MPENFWNHLHFHPTDAVEDRWGQTILRRIAADHAARRIRLYVMLEEIVGRGENGTLTFDFSRLNGRLDFMVQNKFQLLLCFNFMPQCMAEDPDALSWKRYKGKRFNSSRPTSWQEWGTVCGKVTMHLVERYGVSEIEKWLFQCWNEPDQVYWLGGKSDCERYGSAIGEERMKAYCILYDFFEYAVHSVDPKIRCGGPSVALNDAFFRGFLIHCKSGTHSVTGATGSRLDFISVHAYSEFAYEGQINTDYISPDNILNRLRHLRTIADETIGGTIPFLMDEWGGATMGMVTITENEKMRFRETEYFAAFYIRLIDLLVHSPDLRVEEMLLCLSGQDYSRRDFDGCRTLFTVSGFPKPIYQAFCLATLLEKLRMAVTSMEVDGNPCCGIIPTTSGENRMVLILYRCESLFRDADADHECLLELRGVSGTWRRRAFRIDASNANSYRCWTALGSPEYPSMEEREQIAAAGELKSFVPDCLNSKEQDHLLLSVKLPSHTVVLLELMRETSEEKFPLHDSLSCKRNKRKIF